MKLEDEKGEDKTDNHAFSGQGVKKECDVDERREVVFLAVEFGHLVKGFLAELDGVKIGRKQLLGEFSHTVFLGGAEFYQGVKENDAESPIRISFGKEHKYEEQEQ